MTSKGLFSFSQLRVETDFYFGTYLWRHYTVSNKKCCSFVKMNLFQALQTYSKQIKLWIICQYCPLRPYLIIISTFFDTHILRLNVLVISLFEVLWSLDSLCWDLKGRCYLNLSEVWLFEDVKSLTARLRPISLMSSPQEKQ